MRKTKIVCTLGPATDDERVLCDLLGRGMDVARLNFSHGSHEEHQKRAETVKRLRSEMGLHTALLLDTKGPEIRLGKFETGSAQLVPGEIFVLTTEEIQGNERIASVSYKNLPRDVKIGDRILIADGLIELRVQSTTDTEVRCAVVNGGPVGNNKGMNVPGVRIGQPFISDRDRDDLRFAVRNDFDLIAASFTRSAVDVKEMRGFLDSQDGSNIKIIAKIENRDGVNNVDEILTVADGIMVARGDMGVEIPFEELPHIQKKIIRACVSAGKPVITATQMLESMVNNPRPTRAEITDVANAIYDGTSAIMLSGETSIGKHPVEAVATMALIAEETEKSIDYNQLFERTQHTISNSVTNAISHATCSTALSLNAAAIIAVTQSGYTARMVSKYRPGCPIIANTVDEKVQRQLSLLWGVKPVCVERKESTDEIFRQAIEKSLATGIIGEGDLVVIAGGLLANISGTTNTIRVYMVGDVLIRGTGGNEHVARGILRVAEGTDSLSVDFNSGDIAVVANTTDELLPLLKHAGGIISEEPVRDSKALVVGRTLGIPVIVEAVGATRILRSGITATLNAREGIVYSGLK
ncbi:MAG: pyruvate kinase [Spirochaetes bacterium]|nr:pyruvate kinase [Spirochaetota bacterium]